MDEKRLLQGMGSACQYIGLPHSEACMRGWLGELQNYSLVRVEEKRGGEERERRRREARVTLLVSSEEIRPCM